MVYVKDKSKFRVLRHNFDKFIRRFVGDFSVIHVFERHIETGIFKYVKIKNRIWVNHYAVKRPKIIHSFYFFKDLISSLIFSVTKFGSMHTDVIKFV